MVSATLSRLAAPLVCLFAMLLLLPLHAEAQEVPRILAYQGQLLEDETTPVEGPQEVTFRLHPGASGSTTIGSWEETRTVEPANGVFSVLLGNTEDGGTALPDAITDQPEVYLGVSVNGTEIDRVRLTSTVFALGAARAQVAGLAERAEIADVAEAVDARAVDTAGLADAAVTGSKIADGVAVRRLSVQQGGSIAANLQDQVTLIEGDNVSFSTDEDELTISAAAPDGGLSSVSSDGTLTGNGTASNPLGVDAIDSANLVEGAVGNRELAEDAVSSSKIQEGAVTGSKLSADAAVLELNSLTGALSLRSTDNSLEVSSSGTEIDLSLAEGATVGSLNDLTGSVVLRGGSNVTIATDDDANELSIGVETEGLAAVSTDESLQGDGSEDAPLGIAADGVGRDELANDVAVDRLNSLRGDVTIAVDGGAGISTDNETNTITITAGSGGDGDSGIQSISNTDGALSIGNGSGPSTTINVQNDGIETSMLANEAVTTDKLAPTAVQSQNIGSEAITAGKIAIDAVREINIQNNSITADKILSGTITASELSSNSVGASELIDGAVGRSALSDDAAVLSLETPAGNSLRGEVGVVAGDNIVISDNADDQLTIATSGDVLTSVITDESLAGSGTSGSSLRIATDGVSGSNIQDGAVGSGEIADNTVVRTLEYQNNGGSTTGPFRDVITLNAGSNLSISDDGGSTLTIDADLEGASVLTDVTIDGDGTSDDRLRLADNAVSESKIEDGAVTGIKADDSFLVAGENISIQRDGSENFEVSTSGVLTAVAVDETTIEGNGDDSPLSVGTITSNELDSGSVGTAQLQNGTVTGAKAATGFVTDGDNISVSRDGSDNFVVAAPGVLTGIDVDESTIVGDGEGTPLSVGTITSDELAGDAAVLGLGIEDAAQLTGGVTLIEGTDVTLTQNDAARTITIDVEAPDGGLTSVETDGTTILGDGTVDGELTVGTIGSAQIAEDAITTTELDAGAVQAGNIAGGAVGTTQLAPDAVTSAIIADGTIGTADIGTDVVTADEIAAGAVGTDELADNTAIRSITADGATLSDGVTFDASGDASISVDEATDTITFSATAGSGGLTEVNTDGTTVLGNGDDVELSVGTIGSAQIAEDAITTTELDAGAVATANIEDGAVTGAKAAGTFLSGGTNIDVSRDVDGNFEIGASNVLTEVTTDGTLTGSGTSGTPLGIAGGAAVLSLSADGGAGLTDAVNLIGGTNVTLTQTDQNITIEASGSGGTAGVETLNDLDGALSLASDNSSIGISPSGTTIDLQVASGAITSTELSAGAVENANLASGAVEEENILDGAVTTAKIGPAQVTADEIATGAVGADELADDTAIRSITADGVTLSDGISFVAAGDASISVNEAEDTITFSATAGGGSAGVETLNGLDGALELEGDDIIEVSPSDPNINLSIADNSITETQLAGDAVTSAIIADGTISAADIGTDAVTADEIAADAVGTDELADNTAVRSIEYQNDGGTLSAAFQDGVVLNAGTNLTFTDDGVDTITLNVDDVEATVLTDGTLVGDGTSGSELGIANGAVGNLQLADGAVQEVNILDGAVTADKLSTDAAVRSISDGTTTDAGALTFDSADESIDITVDGAGTVNFEAATGSTSAARYKEAVEQLENPAELLAQLRGVRYQWIEDGRADVGMIADEVAEVLPELVTFNDAGEPERLHYSRLVAVLVEAAKAQEETVARQQEQIDEMEERIARLEQMVTQMAEAGN